MTYKRVVLISFSPTGNTLRVGKSIAGAIAERFDIPVILDDITTPDMRREVRFFHDDEIVVIGTPVYASRVPNLIAPELSRILSGSGTPAVAFVTFGNRSYGDAPKELQNILLQRGFSPMGACAIVCKHAFASIGEGRPDAEDKKGIGAFCDAIVKALQEDCLPRYQEQEVGPYYIPRGRDGEPVKFLKAKPVTDADLCDGCGICVHVCPMGSIDETDPMLTSGVCIKCHACINACPKGAKRLIDEAFLSHKDYLEEHYREAAAPVFSICR